jgi:hypothetical protein
MDLLVFYGRHSGGRYRKMPAEKVVMMFPVVTVDRHICLSFVHRLPLLLVLPLLLPLLRLLLLLPLLLLFPLRLQGHWSAEEDANLLKLHAQHGHKWSDISKHLKGRGCKQVRYRWHQLNDSRSKSGGSGGRSIRAVECDTGRAVDSCYQKVCT